jgi:hypothetical protein
MKPKNNLGRVIYNLNRSGKNFQNFHGRHNIAGETQIGSIDQGVQVARLVTPVADFRAPSSAATFDLLINRLTSNIPDVLYIPLFGVLDQESDWIEIMGQKLPATITYAVARGADRKSLDFTFTQGANVDVVNVSCNQTPWVNMMIAGLDSVFKMQQNKIEISDVAIARQFSYAIGIYNRSMFGHNENDTITPNQYKTDMQNQNDIRVINQILDIDKQRSLLMPIVNHSEVDTPFLVTMSSFISKYDKGQMAGNL